jgi:hypothetical protein
VVGDHLHTHGDLAVADLAQRAAVLPVRHQAAYVERASGALIRAGEIREDLGGEPLLKPGKCASAI